MGQTLILSVIILNFSALTWDDGCHIFVYELATLDILYVMHL